MKEHKIKNKLSYNISILIIIITLCVSLILGWSISYVFGAGPLQVTDDFINTTKIDTRFMFDIVQHGGQMKLNRSSCVQYGPNWVSVPANAELGTNHFCMMKFEARNVGGVPISTPVGLPWVNITGAAASAACVNNFTRLITPLEWSAMARSAEYTAWNWSSGIVGIGKMNDGHSDNAPSTILGDIDITNYCHNTGQTCSSTVWNSQRRVFRLTNGELVWDVAGNVGETANTRNITINTNIQSHDDGRKGSHLGGMLGGDKDSGAAGSGLFVDCFAWTNWRICKTATPTTGFRCVR